MLAFLSRVRALQDHILKNYKGLDFECTKTEMSIEMAGDKSFSVSFGHAACLL